MQQTIDTFSREKLQGLAEEWRLKRLYSFINQNVTPGVLACAREGKKNFLYQRHPSHQHGQTPEEDELLMGLTDIFPGCTIECVEEWIDEPQRKPHLPPTRVLKKGIKIDWS